MNQYNQELRAHGEVGLSCVFPFKDGHGVHNGCRELIGYETDGIEDTDYKVTWFNEQFREPVNVKIHPYQY